ncbi:MAG: LysM peptidoglycan-binding domain-containing protein [Rikenellaceae bacterium]
MKRTIHFLLSIFLLILCVSDGYSSETDADINFLRSKKIRYVKHTVLANEDIYEILNRYGLTFTSIQDDNSSIDLFNLISGTTLLINKKEISTAKSWEIEEDLKKYDSIRNKAEGEVDSAGQKKYILHTVKKGESLYSLGRQYRVSISSLEKTNPTTIKNGELKIGSTIKILNKAWGVSHDDKALDSKEDEIIASRIYKKFSHDTPAKIALLMPFKNSDNNEVIQFTEFYQGFMLGLDSMRNNGISVNLDVYNTERSVEKAMSIVKNNELNLVDLIVGPVYSDQFSKVADWASLNNVPIVSPLALTDYDNNGVFKVAPDDDTKYDKIKDYLLNKNIIYIKSIDDDEEFVNKIKELSDNPDILELEFDPKAEPMSIVDTLVRKEINLFIVATKKGDIADAILSKLSSVKTFAYNKQIEVLCSSQIARTQQVNAASMFKLNVSYLTTYHVDRTDENVMSFDNKYISLYGEVPSLYAYRGYDIALVFLKAMLDYGSDFANFMNNYRQKTLSVEYNFKSTLKNGYENDSWTFVTYTPNYKILVR